MYTRFERVSAALIFVIALLGMATGAMAQTKPVPLINQPLVPDAVASGGPTFTLTVNGTGFVNKSVVEWNGSKRRTTVVSHSQLTATISVSDIATTGTASVTVVNPAPTGGTSNVAFLSITDPTPSVTFSVASSPASGTEPASVAVGDFNGDGKLDLAVANSYSNTLSILLGDGMGNFNLASSPVTGSAPYSVAVGDFNGDGKLDLAVANGDSDTISVFLGDGMGDFVLASSPETGITPGSVAVGDFNGDGKLDLAVANFGDNTVSVLLGDGAGNFTLASSHATGVHPFSVTVGDFNGDNKLDLAVVNECGSDRHCTYQMPGTVSILLGDGAGNFNLASSPATGNAPVSAAVGDFNGDGKLDLAVANQVSNTLSILLGDGTGNFSLASSPATGTTPVSVAVGDFNGDGKLDLAVANGSYGGTLSILLGDGAGGFSLASSPATGHEANSVAVGDFTGDGRLDLAVADFGDSAISILVQAPAVTLSGTTLAFGNQNIGTASNPMSSTLTNTGSATLTLAISVTGSDASDFSQTNTCGTTVAAGASCTISVTFTPMVPGPRAASIAITDNAGDSPQEIALSGTGIGPLVTLSSTSLSFGNQMVGTSSAPQPVMLTNTGNAPLTISSIGTTGDFSQTNNCGGSVGAGGSCTINVTFSPTAPGTRTGSLIVTDNAINSPQSVSLTGTGLGPAVSLSAKNLGFAVQLLGTTSAPLPVTLTNSGNETLTISGITASGDFSQTNTCGGSVAAGANCTVSVTFTPTAIGKRTGSVTINDNAFDSPQIISLSGKGTEVTLSPASLTFPVQLVATTSAPMNLMLTNVGSASFNLTGITITGANAPDFSETNTCGSSVGAGQSCTISVTFTPTAANTRTASVSVSDNGGGSPQTVALSGTGTVVELSAGSLNFGKVKVGKISQPKIVVLTNVGTTTLTITSIKVTGTDNGDFSASNTCHGSVSPGGSCNIVVRFIPTQMGLRTADVSIIDDGGGSPQEISLKGTGT